MRKIMLVMSMVALCVACGSKSNPAEVVEECWQRFSEGDVRGAVELMVAEQEDAAVYCEVFEAQREKVAKAGGLESFEVLSLSEGESDATVEAAVVLGNGQRIEATYHLRKEKKGWLIAH